MDEDKFHATALARFDASWSLSKDVREDCHAAGRFCFVPGAQYEGKTQGGSDYAEMAKRFPKFEINKVRAEVLRIVNEYKNSRIAAKFRPGSSQASEDLADKLNGKMLADSEDSAATEAKNNAFTEALSAGFGCYRLSTLTDDEEGDDLPPQIVFDPIYDATATVWFDTDSKRQDKSDANWAFVMHAMTPAKFKQEYGNKGDDTEGDADSMPQTLDGGRNYDYNWTNGNVISVAQYYERRRENVKFVAYVNPLTGHRAVYDEEQIAAIEDELAAVGYRQIDEKTKKVWRVYCSVISGDRVLEKAVRLPGSYIPLVPVYGQRNYLDNVEYITGHVQPSMDSQRLYNYSVSAIAKTAQFGGRAIPIVNDGEVLGYENDWANALSDDAAYVRLAIPDDVEGTNRASYRPGLLGTLPPVQVPQAITQLLEVSDGDITSTAASGQSNQEVPGNVASETVASFMTRTDMQSYGYMDNMAIAERHMAKIWLSMGREVYGSEQEVRIKRPDGSDEITHLSVQVMDRESGQITAINDLTTGKYDVAIDVGPSFVTQRQATVAMLVELLKTTPEQNPYYNVLYAMLIQNVYAPGMEPLKEFNQKQMLLSGIVPPKTPQEAQEIQAAQQQQAQAAQNSPQALLAKTQMIQAVAKARSSVADELNAKAKVLDTITDTWVKEAQAYNYVKGADAKSIDSAMNVLQSVTDNLAADMAARVQSTTSQEMR
ncbi:portal protein [Lelliottia wanjuensis]|uniref:portal protein n=1 Tax=Lelliottia wanjuensis TaxID=3050585 RepID=UPI00254C6657|nr:portal protein [Lelliottia sp. V86_10]MDK9585422.1 portal protein [Lelliottia sp. V86_10]